MPCNCDHLESTSKEVELSRIACLLDELNGKRKRINQSHWDGYHPSVYSKPVNGDAMIEELCSRLQKEDVSKRSLEMQIWWRDHQQHDKEKLQSAIAKERTDAAKKAALKKLSPYERKLLGL